MKTKKKFGSFERLPRWNSNHFTQVSCINAEQAANSPVTSLHWTYDELQNACGIGRGQQNQRQLNTGSELSLANKASLVQECEAGRVGEDP